jgi:hypothetical protein
LSTLFVAAPKKEQAGEERIGATDQPVRRNLQPVQPLIAYLLMLFKVCRLIDQM